MDNLDHLYTTTTHDKYPSSEVTYKMGPNKTEDFVKLRASNSHLFSGKRDTAKYGWRLVLKHMGLQGVMTYYQAKRKWDNMKKKYKDLKYPPEGVMVSPENWPYFSLMDDALSGRLNNSAPVLTAQAPSPGRVRSGTPRNRVARQQNSDGSMVEVIVNGEDYEDEEGDSMEQEEEELESERAQLEHDRETLESERELLEREKQAMERERTGMLRETTALYRDQACLERERAAMERERALMDKEKARIEKDTVALRRERRWLTEEREALERRKEGLEKERTEEGSKSKSNAIVDPEVSERRERFISLFEELIKTL